VPKDLQALAEEVASRFGVPAGDFLSVAQSLAGATEGALRHTLAAKQLRKAQADRLNELYLVKDGALFYQTRDSNGSLKTQRLTNFDCRILEQTIFDDGATERGELLMDLTLDDGRPLGSRHIPLSQFPMMNWVVSAFGTQAVVAAGLGSRDHARAAIQLISGDVPTRRVYQHTGWRRIDGAWLFLHGGSVGPIGPNGPVTGIDVHLPEKIACVSFPQPPTGQPLLDAIRQELGLLHLAPDRLTVPLLGMVFRAVLAEALPVDASGHLAGASGLFKSEVAAIMQAHFGADFNRLTLPAAWSATANALEKIAHTSKDILLVVDDFAPTGGASEVARLHSTADRLLRGAGNQAGRERMAADGNLRPTYSPRALILSTGEDVPRGQSLRARLTVLTATKGDVDVTRLGEAQEAAAKGVYAGVMAAYLQWLAPLIDDLRRSLRGRQAEFRQSILQSGMHRRTPDAVASLALGWEHFLLFAVESGAITVTEQMAQWGRVWAALCDVATEQANHQQTEDPAVRFLSLLASAVASGRGHLASEVDSTPMQPSLFGWREAGVDEHGKQVWRAQGPRIGWTDELHHVYLDHNAAYALVQQFARDQNDSVALTAHTLWRRLHEQGALVTVDEKRGKHFIRRTFGGAQHAVLHLHVDSLLGVSVRRSGHSGQTGQADGATRGEDGPNWPDNLAPNADGAEFRAKDSGQMNGHVPEGNGIAPPPFGPNGPNPTHIGATAKCQLERTCQARVTAPWAASADKPGWLSTTCERGHVQWMQKQKVMA